ncbi:MAG: hypothetical protein H6713_34335 [Myxococcales bacterium]|nr:hypothetical protein [Myxococcales bacterium]
MEATIERTLGAAPAAALTVDALVTQADAARWRLELEIAGASGGGTRELTASSCGELVDAAALVIAIAMNPELDVGEPTSTDDEVELPPPPVVELPVVELPAVEPPAVEPPASFTSSPTSPPSTAPDRLDEPAEPVSSGAPNDTSRSRSSPVRGYARVGGGVGLGALPGPAAVLGAEAGAFARGWRVGLGFDGWLPKTSEAPDNPEIGGQFSLWMVRPRACGVPAAGAFSFPLCVGLELGTMRGTGTGALAVSQTARALWGAAAVTAGFAWSRRIVGLWLDAGAHLAFARPAFRTVQTPLVYEASTVGGRFVAGLELRFP